MNTKETRKYKMMKGKRTKVEDQYRKKSNQLIGHISITVQVRIFSNNLFIKTK